MGKTWEFLGKKLGKSWQKKPVKPCYYSIVRNDKWTILVFPFFLHYVIYYLLFISSLLLKNI